MTQINEVFVITRTNQDDTEAAFFSEETSTVIGVAANMETASQIMQEDYEDKLADLRIKTEEDEEEDERIEITNSYLHDSDGCIEFKYVDSDEEGSVKYNIQKHIIKNFI